MKEKNTKGKKNTPLENRQHRPTVQEMEWVKPATTAELQPWSKSPDSGGSSPPRHPVMTLPFFINACISSESAVSAWYLNSHPATPVQLLERKQQCSWGQIEGWMKLIFLRTHVLKMPMIVTLILFTFLTARSLKGRTNFHSCHKGAGETMPI